MPVTPTRSTAFFLNVAKSILESAADALRCNGLEVPDRFYVGFDRPPQDCCPELTAWAGNVRTWDGDFPDTRRSGDIKCHIGYAFDVTIRIGRCYLDMDESGQPLDSEIIEDWAGILYADATALYVGWIGQWKAGNVSELSQCDLVNVGAMSQYHEGGCAGHEFIVTVGAF